MQPLETEKEKRMKQLLIIEDDQRAALAMAVRLKTAGYVTWLAQDGITGLKIAVAHRPDAILLDISLPGVSGFTLAQQLNEVNELREIPMIFVTGSSDPDLDAKAIEMGGVGLVRKPYDAAQLLSVLHLALGEVPNTNGSAVKCIAVQNQSLNPKKILIVE